MSVNYQIEITPKMFLEKALRQMRRDLDREYFFERLKERAFYRKPSDQRQKRYRKCG